MTWSLVGSRGAVANTTTSPLTLNAGQASTAGNLLVATIGVAGGSAPSVTTPANWALRKSVAGNVSSRFVTAYIFDYLGNPGSISSVAFVNGGTNTHVGQLSEYTCPNAATAAADQVGGNTAAAAATLSAATAGTIAANNELAIAAFILRFSAATSITFAPGAGFTEAGNFQNGVSSANHAAFDFELDTGGSSSGTTITDGETGWSTGTGTAAFAIATYTQGTAAATPRQPPRPFEPIHRSYYW